MKKRLGIDAYQRLISVIDRFDAPFFFYDLDALKNHLQSMATDLDPDITLWYACKANPMSAVLKVLRNLGFGIDVASSGELHQVLNTGIQGDHIIATGPGKSKSYLKHLVKNGVGTIVLESLNQAYWLSEVCEKLDTKVDALLRVQLSWDQGKSVLGGNEITPFGIDSEQWLKLDQSKTKHINIKGFHAFQWGNILDVSKLEGIWSTTTEQCLELSEKLNIPCEIIDLGGGLGVHYDLSTNRIDFGEVHKTLKTIKKKYQLKKIWMELGRYTVAECGYYLNKIIDIKEVRGRNILVCEGGINHIARPALVGEHFPVSALDNESTEKKTFHVHGPLCTALDFLGEFELPANIKIGDWLVHHKTGAYGFTESMPYFLCHKLPGEVISYNGDLMIPRPPKTSYDWMI